MIWKSVIDSIVQIIIRKFADGTLRNLLHLFVAMELGESKLTSSNKSYMEESTLILFLRRMAPLYSEQKHDNK
jgi:hypothetical protein